MNIARSLLVLLFYQLVGTVIVRAFALPVPGPVIGMLLLFLTLVLKGSVWPEVESAANALLRHLSLLFVPAGVGIVTYLSLLRREWLGLLASVVGSTLLALVATALTMQGLMALKRRRAGGAR